MLTPEQIQDLKNKNIVINNSSMLDTISDFNACNYFKIDIDNHKIIQRFQQYKKQLYPVGVQGLSNIGKEEEIGSHRVTVHDKALADYLTPRILSNLSPLIELDEFSPVDWKSYFDDSERSEWELLGVSPVFRYMEYSKGGKHNPHYDSEYIQSENVRTLFSGVLYLTTNDVYTRIIDDQQSELPFKQRNVEDWKEGLKDPKKVHHLFPSKANYVSIFPHRLCHDVTENKEEKLRIIIRFDILCKRIK